MDMGEKGWQDELKYVPQHKMGFKLLGEAQIENMFPSWRDMLSRIEIYRKSLEKLDDGFKKTDSQYYLMYDNIFSIMGKRGSGKTSAIFTLKSFLKNNKPYDRVLPIIMPEIIPKECSMIGWVLALLEQTVKDLNDHLEQTEREERGFSTCLYQPKKSLQREYEEIKELCFSQCCQGIEVNSMSQSVINFERMTQNSFNFSTKLTGFWNSLVYAIKEKEHMKDREPLIYLIFDDVDLVPDRVVSLFSTIIKYLSHPNLIVFVTADEELLYDVIENDINNRMGKNDELRALGSVKKSYFWDDYNAKLETRVDGRIEKKLNILRETPRYYCDKVLPPACRYYLESFESCERKSTFIAEVRMEDVGPKYETLGEFVRHKVDEYIAYVNKENTIGKCGNFLIHNGKLINSYLSFFGSTARQLANEKLILSDFIFSLKNIQKKFERETYNGALGREQYFTDLYNTIYSFVYNSLNADAGLGMAMAEIKEFIDSTIMLYHDEWGIYIHYHHLKEWMLSLLKNDFDTGAEEIMKRCMVFYTLLFFVENILLIESCSKSNLFGKVRERVHGQTKLRNIWNETMPGEYSLLYGDKSDDGLERFLYVYEKVFEKPEILIQFNLMIPSSVRNYFYALRAEDQIKDEENIGEVHKQSPDWLKTMTGALFLSRECVYNISRNHLPSYQLGVQFYVYDAFFKKELEASRYRFVDIMCKDRVDQMQEKLLEKILSWKEKEDWGIDEDKIRSKISRPPKKLSEIEAILNRQINEKKREVSDKNAWEMIDVCIGLLMQDESYKKFFKDAFSEINSYSPELYTRFEEICNRLKTDLLDLYQTFESYRILDKGLFKKALNMVSISFSSSRNTVRASELNDILMGVSNKAIEVKQREKMDANFTVKENWQKAYRDIAASVELFIEGNESVDNAIKIVALHKVLDYFERIYLNMYLDHIKMNGSRRIDINIIPYKKLYEKIIDTAKENTYLGRMLKRYISEYADDYYSSIIEG